MKRKRRIEIQQPLSSGIHEEIFADELRRYMDMVPQAPEPNCSRVQEIKEDLRRGRYKITPEILEETAARLAARFLQAE